jgi:type IV pilus assembly protein PilF
MRRIAIHATAVMLALFLGGCQTTTVRPGDATAGDGTGELGSPVRRASPGDIYVELGTAYLTEGQVNEAFKNARKAVLVDPNLAPAHTLLGVLYQHLGQTAEAQKHLSKAVQLAPHDPYALNALGSFLCSQGKPEEGDSYFRRALNNPLYPTPWVALHNAASCEEQEGKMELAERDYRAALRHNPRFAPALLRMAFISFEQEKYLSARAYLQRYAAEAPHTAESLWLGVRTEKQLGDKDMMASYAVKLRARFPDSDQAKFLEAINKP